MARVNISQASRMTGKSRTTIHRKLKSGALSSDNGLIDTSELIRVFGALVTHDKTVPKPNRATHDDKAVHVSREEQEAHRELRIKYEALQRELELEREVKEALKEQIRLLEHKPAPNMYENSHRRSEYSENAVKDKAREREKEGRLIKLARFVFDT